MKMTVKLCIRLFLLALIGLTAAAQAADDKGLMISASRLQELRAQPEKWKSMRKRCEKELNDAPHAVDNFAPAPHYTSSGVSHDESARYLNIDAGVAYRSALCFQLTGDPSFARHTQSVAQAWATTLKYVQKGQGSAEVNFNMPQLIVAASWVRSFENWDDKAFRQMLVNIAAPASHVNHANNHGNWGVLLETAIAAYLEDESLLSKAKSRWETLMLKQVAEDGSLPLEICRSNTNVYCGGSDKGVNGISYTHYLLLPTTLAAEIFYQRGQNLYVTEAGERLHLAYSKAAEWTQFPERFPYFDSNHGKLNGVRNAAYFYVLQRYFQDPIAGQAIEQGALSMNSFELNLVK
jgi:hypothetical protein